MKRVLCLLASLALAASLGCDSLKAKAPPAEKVPAAEKELSAEKKFALAKECAVAGKKYYDEYVRSRERDIPTTNGGLPVWAYQWGNQEYHYNSRLNTCLVYIPLEMWDTDAKWKQSNEFVYDVFSNKMLLNRMLDKSAEGFDVQKDILFSE